MIGFIHNYTLWIFGVRIFITNLHFLPSWNYAPRPTLGRRRWHKDRPSRITSRLRAPSPSFRRVVSLSVSDRPFDDGSGERWCICRVGHCETSCTDGRRIQLRNQHRHKRKTFLFYADLSLSPLPSHPIPSHPVPFLHPSTLLETCRWLRCAPPRSS